MNAVTKTATLGVVQVMAGGARTQALVAAAGALLLATALQVFTSPVGSFALGRAAYRAGTPLTPQTRYDELATATDVSPPWATGR